MVERGTVIAEVMGTGTLEARISATVSPKISGRVAELLVDQGDHVERGMLLVQLEDDELQQQVAIAEANVEAAQAAVSRLIADKDRATVVFEQAQRNHTRIRNLVQQEATTQEEFEKATEALAVAVADVSRAEAGIQGGQKDLIAAEKTLQYHQSRLQDTRITAPFHGLVISRHREVGDVVVPGSSILTLISLDVLWIQAWVDETQMADLAKDQPARIVFRSEPEKEYPGQVARIARETDRETRELVVDVQVHELPPNWAIGQRAEVYIETARKSDVPHLPTRLLQPMPGGKTGVLTLVDGIARLRPLTLGLRGQDQIEVLSGLDENDVLLSPPEHPAEKSLEAFGRLIGRRVTLR
jgi:HlyD family secretion protein